MYGWIEPELQYRKTLLHINELAAEAARNPGRRRALLATIKAALDDTPHGDWEENIRYVSYHYSRALPLGEATALWPDGELPWVTITTLPEWPSD